MVIRNSEKLQIIKQKAMANQKTDSNKYDFASTDLLVFIWEKRIPLGIISFIAAVLSIIVSFTIAPLFKSTVIMFPTRTVSFYKDRFGMFEIGEDDQAEQLLQVLNAEEIKNRIVEKYNLMEHYKIDTTASFPLTRLNNIYRSNIRYRRTEFMSIQIDVLDKDPQMAADIANDISAFTDTVFNNMLKGRALDFFRVVENEYNDILRKYDKMKDSLDVIRSLGVNNYLAQSDRYHEAYGRALVNRNNEAVKTLDEKFKILSKYGGVYDSYNGQLSHLLEVLSWLQIRYTEAKLEVDNSLPQKFLVDKAVKAEKKAYPKKSLIVIVSTISAFLITLILLIISDNLKKKLKLAR